jgi:hypothetical protein
MTHHVCFHVAATLVRAETRSLFDDYQYDKLKRMAPLACMCCVQFPLDDSFSLIAGMYHAILLSSLGK